MKVNSLWNNCLELAVYRNSAFVVNSNADVGKSEVDCVRTTADAHEENITVQLATENSSLHHTQVRFLLISDTVFT